jgi:ATP-dependent DNA helicase RecQ
VAHNLELLKQMTFYATGSDCLRARLLSYFGERGPSYCGNCSNCKTIFEPMDISLEAQKIISCVYRVKQRGRNFGKIMIIDILRGGKTAKISSLGLDTLSTYGIMADTAAHRIRSIMDHLIGQGYLTVGDGEYPVVDLTPRSRDIIVEKRPLTMMLPREEAPQGRRETPELAETSAARFGEGSLGFSVTKTYGNPRQASAAGKGGAYDAAEAPVDEALLTKLKDLRRELAQAEGKPAYIVFSDATLKDMCRKKPATTAAFLTISGVGEYKKEKYGEAFTKLIQEYVDEDGGNFHGADE